MSDKTELATHLLEDLKEVIREGRELLKDLKSGRKDAEETVRRLTDEAIEARIESEVRRGLEEYKDTIRKAMDDAVDKVGREFQKLEDIFLGKDSSARRDGKPSLEELAEGFTVDQAPECQAGRCQMPQIGAPTYQDEEPIYECEVGKCAVALARRLPEERGEAERTPGQET